MSELLNKDINAEVKSALEKTQFPFFVLGAIAFGSRAKGTEIVLIKRCLPALPFDILLLTRDEVVSNFKNHNPLFLDIAIESGFYDKAVYHFQQAIEKSIKSVLIAMGVFQKTPFVGEILRITVNEKNIADEWKKRLLEIAEISEGVEPEVSLSRYPGIINDTLWLPSGEYERMDAEETMKKAGKVLQVSKEFTDDWFFPGYSAEDGS